LGKKTGCHSGHYVEEEEKRTSLSHRGQGRSLVVEDIYNQEKPEKGREVELELPA